MKHDKTQTDNLVRILCSSFDVRYLQKKAQSNEKWFYDK